MQIKCLSNGSYSLKNCHNPFGKAFQPTPPYGKMPVEHLKSLYGSSLTSFFLTPLLPLLSLVFTFQPNISWKQESCDYVELNAGKICLTWFQRLRDKVFAAYHFIVSPVLPKLISTGPCPLTAVACSVNKGLVLVRPLLYTQRWSNHSSLLSAIERQKPGQCLLLQTCGTAFTHYNWFKLGWTLNNLKYINPAFAARRPFSACMPMQWGLVRHKLSVLLLHWEQKKKSRFGQKVWTLNELPIWKWINGFTRHSTLLNQQELSYKHSDPV